MAWNRANSGAVSGRGRAPAQNPKGRAGETACGKTRRGRQTEAGGLRDAQPSRRRRIGLWAVLLIAAVVGGVWWWFSARQGGTAAPAETPSVGRASLLRAANPSARSTEPPSTEDEASAHGGRKRRIPDRVKPDENGVLRWPGGARYVEDYYFHTNAINPYAGQKQLFKAPTDIHISTVVNLEPGQMIIGGYTYDSRFDEQFRKSLEEPVEFSDDDTDEDRRKKQEVVEARKVLLEAMERGESPAKVLQEARDELVRLFQYRQNLREMLTTLEKEGGAQEMYDAYRAANEMLRERGLSEFSTRMIERKLDRLKQQEEGKNK